VNFIYLIRHGRPETPDARTYCIGRGSDPPLSEEGRRQARSLAQCLDGLGAGKVYCSALWRSRETAEIAAGEGREIVLHPGLDEIDVGEWEGKCFDAIRAEYPDAYSARGRDWSISPPGGEGLAAAASRMEEALGDIIGAGGGDALAVTHDGAIRALLWKLMALDTTKDAIMRQSYGSVTVLKCEGDRLVPTAIGKLPEDYPSDDEIEELLSLSEAPRPIRAHGRAVCAEALRIRERLLRAGVLLPRDALRAAALLHDMRRGEGRDHAASAAATLRERGYLKVARLVELHHGGPFKEAIDEAQVLFLADKRIEGTVQVSVGERFAASLKKCATDEAKRNHEIRYREALGMQAKFEKALGEVL
jgi:probable phosphoglycerate mutase